jgi:hypothetical protein
MSLTKVTDSMVLFEVDTGTSVNFTSSSDFPLGSPVYLSSSGTWQLAKANDEDTVAQYLISEKIYTSPITYKALINGEITLTTNQWDQITNGSGGLTTGTIYFLSSLNAGKISINPGLIYAPVLRGISSTKGFVSFSINSIENGSNETFYRETLTTIANTLTVTLNYPPLGKSYVWLSIDGVFQSGNDFDLSGNTITLGGLVSSGTLIDVLYARSLVISNAEAVNRMVSYSETVSGSPKYTFNLPITPAGINSCIVFIGGSVQDSSKFNLSGNVLTMADPVLIGVQIVVYVLNSSGVISAGIDDYVTRSTWALNTNATVSLSTIFSNQVSGLYRIFDINDPRINAIVSLKHNGTGSDPDVRVDSSSSLIGIISGVSGKLNIYISNNLLTLQNLTGNNLSLRLYREI